MRFDETPVLAGAVAHPQRAACQPGPSAADIPWLKLEVTAHKGNGLLTPVTIVQRINTQGGKLDGTCDKADALKSAPYAADYVFLK